MRTLGTIFNVLLMVGYAAAAGWCGYGRRRRYWTRASWIGLGTTMLIGLSLVALTLGISAAVDRHKPWFGPPGSNTRAGWVLASVGLMFSGFALTAVSLGWFAVGDPTRQFPLCGSPRDLRNTEAGDVLIDF